MNAKTTSRHSLGRIGSSLLPALAVFACAAVTSCHDSDHHSSVTVTESFVQVSSGPELEPNNESASPHFLGVLNPGEMMTVTGTVVAGDPLINPLADEFDGFAIALSQESELEFRLSFDDTIGELDTWVYDPVINDIAIFFETDFSPESGFFFVTAPVLDFQIIVRAFTGQSNYTLEIFARAIPQFASASTEEQGQGDEVIASGIRQKAQLSLSASNSHESEELRELAVNRYLRRASRDLDLVDEPVQTGAFIILDDAGGVRTKPILTNESGQSVIDFR